MNDEVIDFTHLFSQIPNKKNYYRALQNNFKEIIQKETFRRLVSFYFAVSVKIIV